MRCTGPHESYCSGQVSGTYKSGASPSIGYIFVPLRTSLVRYALHCLQVVLAGARIANPRAVLDSSTLRRHLHRHHDSTQWEPSAGCSAATNKKPFRECCYMTRSFKWSTGGAPETVRGLTLCLCFFFLVTSIYLHQPFQTSPLV